MKISIITVCYNSAETIRDTIESVLEQTYNNIEYIVVDGLSQDNTMSIVKEYGSRIDSVVSEPDKGIYDAMNKGISLATGDIIGILNSDDFYGENNVLAEVVENFIFEPSADVVFGDVIFVHRRNKESTIRFYSAKHFKSWKLRFGWMPPHLGTFVRSSAYKKVGAYSLDYKISSDFEMFVRCLLIHKMKYSYMNKIIVHMRSGGVSTSGIKNSLTLNMEIVKACMNNDVYTNIFIVSLKIPLKIIEFFRRPGKDRC